MTKRQILYHATDVDSLPGIWEHGLMPAWGHPVHLAEEMHIYEFIHDLGGDIYEDEHGYPPVTITFEVDVTGLDVEDHTGPRAVEFGADNDEHHMCWETIPPERLKIVSVYHGENLPDQ